MDDVERRESAIKRLEARREFVTHLIAYVVVNGFLVVVWAITSGTDGYFWPIWPIAGWAIGLVLHAYETFRSPIGEDAIRREMEKM